MLPTEIVRKAGLAAKVYLEMRGFEVIEQNFRRPRCEIDIIAKKNGIVQFIEVEYHKDYDVGGGANAVSISKMNQMHRGAMIWLEESKWHSDYLLSAVEVSGSDYQIMNFIEDLLY
jgi:putative endonuclease